MSKKAFYDISVIINKLDEILSRNDYSSAADFLEACIRDAEATDDKEALFTLSNECIGLFRKISNKSKCFFYCEKVLALIDEMKIGSSVSGATAFINCATAKKAFGEASLSLPLFEKAQAIYEARLSPDDKRLAGLYNNFALALADERDYDKATELYRAALLVLGDKKENAPEKAITYLNIANVAEWKNGLENACIEIDIYLDKAEDLLNSCISESDGNYAFVCEKCAPTFGYYGRFMFENQLKERARKIYERT